MISSVNIKSDIPAAGVSMSNLRFAIFSTRNLVYLIAVLAMNFTLFRPSPVDLLFIGSLLITLFHMSLFPTPSLTRRTMLFSLILGSWAVSYIVASLPHLREDFVIFELIAKTFAISIGIIAAFVSMTWNRRHFETFMKVYIVSCVIGSILGTIGFVGQIELLTWDGRAKGLIDDPNMYASFLIPAVIFCAYLMSRSRTNKLLLLGAMGLVLLAIFLSLSRIALVAALVCLIAYIMFQNRRNPRRLILIMLGLVSAALLLPALVSVASPEFAERFMERLSIAQPYDLGEQGRYARYLLVLPMILQNPIGVGVLQLEKIFPEPIHNIWLSSFVNYGWGGGLSYITLAVGTAVVSVRNYRRTRSEIPVVILISTIGIIMCSTLHEGEHWRHSWLFYGLAWGLNILNFDTPKPPAARVQPGTRPPPRDAKAPSRRPIASSTPSAAGR